MLSQLGDNRAWLQPDQPLAANLVCGTTVANPDQGQFGDFNLADHVGDAAAAVAANRQELHRHLSLFDHGPQTSGIQWLEQVHGNRVVQATTASVGQVPQADAVWTEQTHLPIAVLTADCLPVVLACLDGSCVGVAHGGWRGLVAGVLEALVAALPVPPTQLRAWGGPGIGAAAYEVGEDVAAQVAANHLGSTALGAGERPGKYQLDLHELARIRLAACGVSDYQACGVCAWQDLQCYSYRRKPTTGRMATLALLTEPRG